MKKQIAVLVGVEHQRQIEKDTDAEFWYQLEYALLLALREQGVFNPMQHRYAEDALKQQRLRRAKQILKGQEG